MIGYENKTSHGYAAMCRAEAEQDAFERRVEELAAEIEAAPFEADDLYCGVECADEKDRVEITALINSKQMLKAAEKIAALMDSARARRAEYEAEQLAEKEFEEAK
jgi:hypothetical protein